MGHAAVVVGNTLVVIGGRHGPAHALGDVWTCDLNAALRTGAPQWVCRGEGLTPRHRHSAAVDQVGGGCGGLRQAEGVCSGLRQAGVCIFLFPSLFLRFLLFLSLPIFPLSTVFRPYLSLSFLLRCLVIHHPLNTSLPQHMHQESKHEMLLAWLLIVTIVGC